MAKYSIEIDYRTGNSFGSHDEVESVEVFWKNLEDAKEALRRIRGHYEAVQEFEEAHYKDIDDLVDKYRNTDWFVDESYWQHVVKVPSFYSTDTEEESTEDTEEPHIHAFWVGYFEDLHSAKIVTIQESTDEELEYIPGR